VHTVVTLASFWSPDWVENIEIVPLFLWLLVPIPVFIGSLILFRSGGGKPLLLVLIGSIAYLIWHAIDLFLTVLFPFVLENHSSWFIQTVWPTCTPHWAFDTSMHILRAISLCFPIGFVWFALSAKRNAPNQTLQPAAGRSDA
jgi:hypothetical protein